MLVDFHTHLLPTAEGSIVPRSFGIHPWQSASFSESDMPQILSALSDGCSQPSITMVGECGLDKLRGASFDFQVSLFQLHLQVAETVGKPVVVHCVRAMEQLVALRRQRQWQRTWVVHGFTGSSQQALQLDRIGIGCSFGAAILNPQHHKAIAALQQLGKDRLFLETDDSGLSIADIYVAAAYWLEITVEELEEAIFLHYCRLIQHIPTL